MKRVQFSKHVEYHNELDQRHREDGPAVIYVNGDKSWHQNGVYHREDGPAIEYINGYKGWYINGEHLTQQEFKLFIRSQTIKSILNDR